MSRLIDADKLPKYTGYALSASEVAIAVEKAPTVDAVPVCRCEKCVYWDAGTRRHNSNDAAEWDEAICDKYHEIGLSCDVWTATDDFCSYGERKGGDE